MEGPAFHVHDLLRIATPDRLRGEAPKPPWIDAALARAPWVVVRRIIGPSGVAVGVRGAHRAERWAAWIDARDVIEQLQPEDLSARLVGLSPQRLANAPALAAAAALEAHWRSEATRPTWGPTGGVGFELASRQPTVGPSSDLDAIIRCPQPIPVEEARVWTTALDAVVSPMGVRWDVLLETPLGAVALMDYARAAPEVMLRTAAGPWRVRDPWADHPSLSP